MLAVLRAFTAALLLASGAVFLYTFTPASRVSMRVTWPLHLGVMVGFGAAVLTLHLRGREARRRDPGLSRWRADARVLATVPARVWVAGGVGGVLLFAATAEYVPHLDGSPAEQDGRYVIQSHGRVLREVTEEEYRRTETEVVRLFASGWVVFSWLAAVFFWLGPGRLVGGEGPTADPAETAVVPDPARL